MMVGVMCGQLRSSSLSLYLSVIESLAVVVGIRRLLADSAVSDLLQRVVYPTVLVLLLFIVIIRIRIVHVVQCSTLVTLYYIVTRGPSSG